MKHPSETVFSDFLLLTRLSELTIQIDHCLLQQFLAVCVRSVKQYIRMKMSDCDQRNYGNDWQWVLRSGFANMGI